MFNSFRRQRTAFRGTNRSPLAPGGRIWWAAFAFGIGVGAVALWVGGSGESATGSDPAGQVEPAAAIAPPALASSKTAANVRDSKGAANTAQGRSEGTEQKQAPAEPERSTAASSQPAGQEKLAPDKPYNGTDKLKVRVYLTKQQRVETVPLEIYVRGVLAGEMPVDFELEALKAQAIAARTYIVRRLAEEDKSGVPVEKADVTDTVDHQAYVPLEELVERWPAGKEREATLGKLTRAVNETQGLVLTYEGEPIEASFFSTSNGYTENAEDYWQLSLPYLKSVASPWDAAISPRYKQTIEMREKELYRRLGAKDDGKPPRILETTEGHRVKTAVIGGETFTGREVREKLSLPSSQFDWTIEDGIATITTYGLGHGVGLSQWGANGMAQQGATAERILLHYYTGVRLEQAYKLPNLLS